MEIAGINSPKPPGPLGSEIDSPTQEKRPIGTMDGYQVDSVESTTTRPNCIPTGASMMPSHYDPLHPVVLANNTFSDTLVYATVVSEVFNIPIENSIAAGIVGNVACALATSPYLSSKMMSLLPNEATRDHARNFDTFVRKLVDPGYLSYYTTAWPALGVATIPEACAFILASAFMRKGASLLLQSDQCKGSLEQQAEALTSTDQALQPSLNALLRVMREFTPDLVASLSRSGVSNLYAHHQGKISAKDVLNKTLFSGAVYVVCTFLYYVCYRALEQLGEKSSRLYQKPADLDRQKTEELKASLETFEPTVNSTPGEDSLSSLEENRQLIATKPQSLSPVSRSTINSLSKNFEILKSPLVSLFKDPIYRSFVELTYHCRKDPDSKNAIEAFRAIDAADLLNKVVARLEEDTNEEAHLAAYKALLNHLGIQIPSGSLPPEVIQDAQERGLDALIKMFQAHASSHDQQKPSLLGAAQAARHSYGAIGSTDTNVV